MELRQCVESVRAQTHKARHFVYVNGPEFHEPARAILKDYPEVTAFYLPEATGDWHNGPSMVDVFAAGPFLTNADWVFYLDDDNWYEPDHVDSVLTLARDNDLKWAYSLRRFVSKDGTPICEDNWCNLGHYPLIGTDAYIVDNSCFAVERSLACRMALAWTAIATVPDRAFLMALKESGGRSGCTGLTTVNYRIGLGSTADDAGPYLERAEYARKHYGGVYPWRRPQVFAK